MTGANRGTEIPHEEVRNRCTYSTVEVELRTDNLGSVILSTVISWSVLIVSLLSCLRRKELIHILVDTPYTQSALASLENHPRL
jgi:hypothetical protein